MIPVIGIPILNRPDLLYKLLGSINQQFGHLVIIDNGDVVEHGAGSAYATKNTMIKLPHNIGVSAAWNLIFKVTPAAPWWFILNSDLELGKDDMGNMDTAMSAITDPKIVQLLGMAAFGINQQVLDKVGLFDENFHPAYCEDVDYIRRCHLAGIETPSIPGSLTHVGSATIHSDERLKLLNDMTYAENREYYRNKWGGDVNGTETFEQPFNNGHENNEVPVYWPRVRKLSWSR